MKKGSLILCFLFYFFICSSQKITYTKTIAPILDKNCGICHYRGGPTPFPLTTYDEVKPKAKFISHVTQKRIMPPWRANPEYRHFANERMMSQEEIDLVKQWVVTGAKKGGGKPKLAEHSIRQELGKPDLTLMMPEPLQIEGNNKNEYHYYKIPYEIEKDTFVKAFEFIPGNIDVLHHATFQVLKTFEGSTIFEPPFTQSVTEQYKENSNYFEYFHMIGNNNKYPEALYGNSWLPGSTVQIYPDMGFHLPKKGVIFFNFIHYSPSPIDCTDSSGIKFYFTDKKPEKVLVETLFKPNFKGNEGMIPKDSVRTIKFKKYIKRSMELYTVIPHMHRLGEYFKAYALSPKGDTIPLVEVNEWDFNWQEYYQFEKPLLIEKGSVIYAEAIFNNSSKNLNNPFDPPVDIFFNDSMNEESEMMHLIFLHTYE